MPRVNPEIELANVAHGADNAHVELKNYLKNIYYNDQNPAAYSSPKVIYDYIKSQGRRDISLKQIINFLKSEELYTTHFPFRRSKFVTPVISPSPRYQFDVDSAYLPSKNKRGNKYFILAIDVFTRKIAARAVKNLKAVSSVGALRAIFRELNDPQRLRSDKGVEYLNHQVKRLLKSKNIKHFLSLPPNKSNYAERAIRTIKNDLYKTMQHRGLPNWNQNMLDNTVSRYNNKKNRSINRTPNSIITPDDEYEVWNYMMRQRIRNAPEPSPYKFELNDPVRIAFLRDPFTKDYAEKFSAVVYFISYRSSPFYTNRYRLKNANNEPEEGSFQEKELQLVKIDADTEYRVESVIGNKRVNGVPFVKVKWYGYDDRFNSWIPKSELVNLNRA